MKKLLLFFSLLLTVSSLQAVVTTNHAIFLDQIYDVKFEYKITVDDFMKMNIKEIEKKRGKKLRFKEKLALKFAKKRMKKMQKKGASQSDLAADATNNSFEIVPFLLGLLLWIIGPLVVWLIWRDKHKTRAAWYGAAVVTILFTLLFVLLLKFV